MSTEQETGTTMAESEHTTPENLQRALRHLTDVVKAVAAGELEQRASVSQPEDHPVGALAAGVNSMVEALSAARSEADSHLGELEERLATIETQREAIRELSTPIIEVWKGVLCMPVVGILDSMRASEITSELLHAIVDRGASYVIIDITGIEVMDTNTTDHFMRLARAVRLLGAECVLSGVNPSVARTVVEMGMELADVKSHRNLRGALSAYVRAGERNGRGLSGEPLGGSNEG